MNKQQIEIDVKRWYVAAVDAVKGGRGGSPTPNQTMMVTNLVNQMRLHTERTMEIEARKADMEVRRNREADRQLRLEAVRVAREDQDRKEAE